LSAHGGEVHSYERAAGFLALGCRGTHRPADRRIAVLAGTILLARRGASGRRFEPIAFAIGWSALVLSILPPIDSLSIEYFSVHMISTN
jgi:hypothetical protein